MQDLRFSSKADIVIEFNGFEPSFDVFAGFARYQYGRPYYICQKEGSRLAVFFTDLSAQDLREENPLELVQRQKAAAALA